jgi:hypothetical protein
VRCYSHVDCLGTGNSGVVLQVGVLSGNWSLRCGVTGWWIVWELVTPVWCYRLVDCLGTGNAGVVLQVGVLSANR